MPEHSSIHGTNWKITLQYGWRAQTFQISPLVGLKGLPYKYVDLKEMWGISRFPVLKPWTRALAMPGLFLQIHLELKECGLDWDAHRGKYPGVIHTLSGCILISKTCIWVHILIPLGNFSFLWSVSLRESLGYFSWLTQRAFRSLPFKR